MPRKFEGTAHAAFAKFAIEHPGETFTAPEIKKAVEAAGFPLAVKGLVPGDHAMKPDGSPANDQPCNCSKDPATALFTQTGGRGRKARYTIRTNGTTPIREEEDDQQAISPLVFTEAVSGITDLKGPEPEPVYSPNDTLSTAIKRMADLILNRCKLGGTTSTRSQPFRETDRRPELEATLLSRWGQQEGACGLCGKPIPMPPVVGLLQPSVDRVDSADPDYLGENLHITHLGCNLAKNRFSVSEYRQWLLVIRDEAKSVP